MLELGIEFGKEEVALLQNAATHGIIDLSNMREQLIRKERKELLKQHKFAIWQGQKGGWYTYLPDDVRGRIQHKRKDRDSLEKLIVDFYRITETKIYIREVFDNWLTEKMDFNEISDATYDKYRCDYKRYFENSNIEKKVIGKITEEDLENFIRKTISYYSLTRKGYSGLRTLILGIFKYAKKRKYTQISITHFFGDLDLSPKIFRLSIRKKEEQVYLEAEIILIAEYVHRYPTIENLGILLAFQTGVRVGELSTLKSDDIDIVARTIHIQRTEVKYKDKQSNRTVHRVQEFPKTECGDRYLIITESAIDTLTKILESNDCSERKFLFEKKGKRILSGSFGKRIMAICKELEIRPRSMHKIRKTYGTTLIDANVDESLIMEQMGHKDISTTKKYYYFSNKDDASKISQINDAIFI